MKKYLYKLWVAAALLLATASCSSEEELIPSGDNGVEVNFKLALDEVSSSRMLNNNPDDDTYGRGKRVNNVIAAVYSNGVEISSLRKNKNSINPTDLTCNVTFRLIEGQKYDFVFWAEKDNTDYYDTDDLKAIKVNYSGNANDEDRDAFTAVRKGLIVKNGGMSETIVLTRPFAQLNIASTDEDHTIAEAAGFGCAYLTSKVKIKGVYDTFNAYMEKPVQGSIVDIDFDLEAVPGSKGEVLKNVKAKNETVGKDYRGYLSMNYFLAEVESNQNIEVTARFESSAGTVPVEVIVPHVPVRRNYRTNIIGNILTEQTIFNIIIDPNFKKPDYLVKTHSVSTFDELQAAASENAQITLSNDIDLTSALTFDKIVMIEGNGHALKGKPITFKGQAVTLNNVKFDSPTATGGKATAIYVQDGNKTFTAENCTFVTSQYEAIQYTSDDVENVTIKNCTFQAASSSTIARHIHLELRDANGYYESPSATAVIENNKFYDVDQCNFSNDKDFICITGFKHANLTIKGNEVWGVPAADKSTWNTGSEYIWISDGTTFTNLYSITDASFKYCE